jgi:hypothetical protein
MEKMNILQMEEFISSHCVVKQCFAKISNSFISDCIPREIQLGDCLYEIRQLNVRLR